MKQLLLAGAAGGTMGALMSAGADAADLPIFVPPPEPAWSWTGPYAGLHVGTIDGDADSDPFFTFKGGDTRELDAFFDPNGILGGVQAGYNYQFDSIVLGIEGDIGFGDVDGVIYTARPLLGSSRDEARIDWMATIRARLGWAWDRTLFYATGGVAFTELEISIDTELVGSDSDKNAMFGWTVGGGVEHAVSDRISLKAEYLYADFGPFPLA